ncbi:hypothetical protein [Paeniroseomonas aquatica]|uniref:hypothetical protein n=1 Tax=Paeniroseomonas aquatica TaxID=373043 RepID=UPI0038D14029
MNSSETSANETHQTNDKARTLAAAKWGDALDAGFQIIPNVLVRGQAKLGLDALDVVILLNVNMHWWQPEDLPYPQPRVIASRMGVSIRTVERRLEVLEQKGLLHRLAPEKLPKQIARRRIDLGGLINRLQIFSRTNLSTRMKRSELDTSLEA